MECEFSDTDTSPSADSASVDSEFSDTDTSPSADSAKLHTYTKRRSVFTISVWREIPLDWGSSRIFTSFNSLYCWAVSPYGCKYGVRAIGLVSFPVKLQALLTTSCDIIAPIIAMAVSVQVS